MAISGYIISFERPVTLAELEEFRAEAFAHVRPDRLIVYPSMGDVGFGRRSSSEAKQVKHIITLSELRRIAKKKKRTPTNIGVRSNNKKIIVVRM